MAERHPAPGPTGPDEDPFAVLGVAPDAEPAALARAYRRAVRAAHPDLGGSAEQFAAVQRAWEAVQDGSAQEPDVVDAWAFDDWGAPEPVPEAAPSAPDDRPPADPESADDAPPAEHDDAAPPARRVPLPAATRAAARTPFAPGAIELGAPTLPQVRAVRPAGDGASGGLDRALRGLARAAAAVAVVTVVVAGSLVPGMAYATLVGWVVLAALTMAVGRRFGRSGLVPWAVPVGVFGVAPAAVTVGDGLLSPAAAILLGAAAAALGAVSAVLVRSSRRASAPAEAREHAVRRAGFALHRHELALAWNEVRDALGAPGARVERLTDAGLSGAGRRVGVDRLGRTTVRDLDLDAREGTWVALDEQGTVLAVAPPGAPEAWSRAVRQAARR